MDEKKRKRESDNPGLPTYLTTAGVGKGGGKNKNKNKRLKKVGGGSC